MVKHFNHLLHIVVLDKYVLKASTPILRSVHVIVRISLIYVTLLLSTISFSRLSNGSLFDNTANIENSIPFNAELYNNDIKNAFHMHHASTNEVRTSCVGEVSSTQYKKDFYVIIGCYQDTLELGLIVMLLQHKDNTICLLVKKISAVYVCEMGYYRICENRGLPISFMCISISDLKSHCCLPSYKIANNQVIVLHHAIVI